MQIQKDRPGYKLVKSLFGKYEEIPEDWDFKSLNEIGDIVGGGTPDTNNMEYWTGEVPWAVPTDITRLKNNHIDKTERTITKKGLEESSAKLLPKGTLLITSRATVGECAINTVPMSTNQGFQNLIPNSKNNNLFCFYAMKFHKKRILRLAYGTTFQEISKTEMKKVSIPVTTYLPEQQKIASILSNVDDLIQKYDSIIDQTKRLKKGLMQKLLTKGIGHTKFKKTKLGEIPQEWEITNVGSVSGVTKLAGFEYTKYIKLEDCGEIPVIRAQNVTMEGFVEKEIKFISKAISDLLTRSQTNGEEILMVFIGANTGNVCLAPKGKRQLGPNVAKITPKNIDRNFLNFYLQSELGQKNTLMWAKSTTLPSLSMGTIRKIILPFPANSEQEKISAILSNIDAYIKKYLEYKSKLETLKKGLMQKILTGQIRVSVS